jgi:hypothetical protein
MAFSTRSTDLRSRPATPADDDPLLESYAQSAAKLVANLTGICVLDRKLR